MNIILKNIGIIMEADVKLDGLTVITGYNGTGKSTVGKALYSVVNSTIGTDEKLNFLKISIIEDIIDNIMRTIKKYVKDERELQKHNLHEKSINIGYLISMYSNGVANIETLEGFVNNFCANIKKFIYEKINDEKVEKNILKNLEKLVNFIKRDSEDKEMRIGFLMNEFKKIFGHQIVKFNETEASIIIKDREYIYSNIIFKNSNVDKELLILKKVFKKIIYIDTMMVLKKDFPLGKNNSMSDDYQTTLNKILFSSEKNYDLMGFEDEDINDVISMFQGVYSGKFVNKEDDLIFVDGKETPLSTCNVASGVKVFGILRRLIEQKNLDMNSMLIIDEPENHLHPEWQVKFAEIIIKLVKDLNINILVNSHSPYFLKAIKYYSKTSGMNSSVNYYFAKNEKGNAKLIDVTDNLAEVFGLMTTPFIELNNLDWLE